MKNPKSQALQNKYIITRTGFDNLKMSGLKNKIIRKSINNPRHKPDNETIIIIFSFCVNKNVVHQEIRKQKIGITIPNKKLNINLSNLIIEQTNFLFQPVVFP
jgi:hypothetical protein